jgi:sigma-B regulation protein RsbU (phosphoserine phosphatase)
MTTSIMDIIINLAETIAVISVVAYLITRTRLYSEVIDRQLTLRGQLFMVAIFGAFSVYAAALGGAANIRNLGPMMAGIVGGPAVGLGAAFFGALYRYFDPRFGVDNIGMVTYSAMLATVLAGLAAGMVYTFRKGELVGVLGAAVFAAVYEVFHFGETLLLGHPFSVVLPAAIKAFPPMIAAHAVGLATFVFILNNLINERMMRAAKERMESELTVARDIQMSIVPKIFPPVPNIREIDIHASIESAREVGGDLYDFFFVDDDHLFFVIGDVSGKGIPASLFMAVSITLLKAKTKEGMQTDNILYKVNNDLCADNEASMFVTIFCGIINIRTGEVVYSNGGHNPPYLRRSSGDVEPLPCHSGLPLGVMEDFAFDRDVVSLKPGDTLVIYTDGVTEAINREEEFFSDGRLEDLLRNTGNIHSARDLVQSISGAVHAFAAGAVQSDDITLLVITYNGPATLQGNA